MGDSKTLECPICKRPTEARGFHMHIKRSHPDKFDQWREIKEQAKPLLTELEDTQQQEQTTQPQQIQEKQEEPVVEHQQKLQQGQQIQDQNTYQIRPEEIWKSPPDKNKILMDLIDEGGVFLQKPEIVKKVLQSWIKLKGEISPEEVKDVVSKIKGIDAAQAEMLARMYAIALQRAMAEYQKEMVESSRSGPIYTPPLTIPQMMPTPQPSHFPDMYAIQNPQFIQNPQINPQIMPYLNPSQFQPQQQIMQPPQVPPVQQENKEVKELEKKFSELSQYLKELEKKREEERREQERREEIKRLTEERKRLENEIGHLSHGLREMQRYFDEKLKDQQIQLLLDRKEVEKERANEMVLRLERELRELRSKLERRPPPELEALKQEIKELKEKLNPQQKEPTFFDWIDKLRTEKGKFEQFAEEFLGMSKVPAGGEVKDATSVFLMKTADSLSKLVNVLTQPKPSARTHAPPPPLSPDDFVSTQEVAQLVREKARLEQERAMLAKQLAMSNTNTQVLQSQQPGKVLQKQPAKGLQENTRQQSVTKTDKNINALLDDKKEERTNAGRTKRKSKDTGGS